MCLCPDYPSRPGLSLTSNLVPPRIELLVVLGRVWDGGETLSLSVASLSIMRAVGVRLTGRRIAHYEAKQKLRTKVLPPHTANKEISHTTQSQSPPKPQNSILRHKAPSFTRNITYKVSHA